MKKRSLLQTAAWTFLSFVCITSLSFTSPGPGPASNPGAPYSSDTIPAITEFETGRLDAALNYVDEQIRTHGGQWNTKSKQVQQQVAHALSEIDLAKLQADAKAAVKKINFEQLNKDIETAMAGIDKAKMERDLSCAVASVKNIDAAQLRAEISAAIKDIRLDQIKKQLETARKDLWLQQRDLNHEMQQLAPGISNELRDTRKQLQRLKDAYQEMERDGLIERGPNNRIQFRENELYINGQKQSPETREKYRHYFNKQQTAPGKIVAV
ncbi:hypothetical protein LL912_06200 [Niabella sp. CC-SYL272]|uniref:hypothetical protein n=1 Tax=Niabella agricola TaxID=2891571 RepID=UPI001F3430A3|nr:hypothetical protein [Niabella agricola]MCF3108363.1 hypothetical protein [Niabella agricola]